MKQKKRNQQPIQFAPNGRPLLRRGELWTRDGITYARVSLEFERWYGETHQIATDEQKRTVGL